MKKLNRVASLFVSRRSRCLSTSGAFAQTVDNWRSTDGTVWKNGTNEHCWREQFLDARHGCQGLRRRTEARPEG